jgi:hypothetical protein
LWALPIPGSRRRKADFAGCLAEIDQMDSRSWIVSTLAMTMETICENTMIVTLCSCVRLSSGRSEVAANSQQADGDEHFE